MEKVKTFRFKGSNTRYAVSEYGKLSNLETGRVLKYYIDGAGYPTVNITVNKQVLKVKLHLAVSELFNRPRPEGFVVDHKDHNKLNIHYSNLQIITYSENTKRWHEYRKKNAFVKESFGAISLEECEITNIIEVL